MPQYPGPNPYAQQTSSPYVDQGRFFASPVAYSPGPGYFASPVGGAPGVSYQGFFNRNGNGNGNGAGGMGQQQRPFYPQRQPSSGGLPLPTSSPMIRAPSSSSSISIPGTPPTFYSNAFSPASTVSPARSRVGHASTPSFLPSTGRRPTLSLAPPLSPTASRGGSPSPSAGSGGFREREREREERKRRVVVKVPRESGEEEDDVEEGELAGQKRSSFTRRPVEEGAKRRRIAEMEEDNQVVDLSTREQHFDEIKDADAQLPPTLEVYLPGQDGWDEIREEEFQRLAYPSPALNARSFNNPLSARLNSFLEQHNSWPASLAPSPPSHSRTGSFFGSSLPPRLQQAFESRIRPGHGSSFSVGGALSALSRTFSMPGTPANVGLSPGVLSFAPARAEEGHDRPPMTPMTPSPQSGGMGMLQKEKGKRLTLAELGRGFGIDEEEEGSGEEKAEEPLALVGAVVEGEDAEREQSDVDSVGSKRSRPSRRDSRMSGISTRTGVASGSDDLSDRDAEGEDDILTNPSEEELSDEEPAQPRPHLRAGSLGTEAMGPSRRERVANYSGEEGGYDGSDDEDGGSEGELELSEDEYSNPSDEDLARERAVVRRKSRPAFHRVEPRGSKGEEPPPDGEDLLFVPSDVEVSPVVVEKGEHKVTPDFHFPPRGPLPTPPKAQPPQPLPLDDTFSAPSSSDLASSACRTSLNVAAPEFVFGATAKPRLALTPTFGRSTSSLGSLGFGSNGGPGSIAADTSEPPSPTKVLPLPNLNPFAGEFKPVFNFTPPADAPTLVLPPSPDPSPTVRPSTGTRSLRGPLPPVPLTTVGHHSNVKRQKVEAPFDSGHQYLAQETESDHGRSFHTPSDSPKSTSNDSPQSRRRDSEDDKDDERPLAQLRDQQLGSMPTTLTTLGRNPSRTPFNSESRPFTLNPSASFSSDGRVMGFAPTSRRPPIPHFGAPGDAPRTGISSNARTSPNDGQRREEQQRDQRQESIDDIALPPISRPRSHAIPIPQRRSIGDLHEEIPTSRQRGSSWVSEPLDDVFGSDEAIPTSPRSVTSRTASGTVDEHEEEDDDYPLRILQDIIIQAQFQGLRQELSGFTSLKADLDSLKRDALLDTLVGRMSTLLNESREADSESRNEGIVALREVVEATQKRTEDALRSVMEELKAEQAGRQLVGEESAKALVVSSPPVVDVVAESRDSLVAALAEAVRQQLSSSSPRNESRDRLQLSEIVDAVVKPLQNLIVENARGPETVSTPGVVDEDCTALASKVDEAISLLERSAATLEELKNRETAETPTLPPLGLSFVDELKSSIDSLRQDPLDVGSLVAKLSQANNATFEDFATRLSAKDDTTVSAIEDLRIALEALSVAKSDEHDALASKLAEQVQALPPALLPPAGLTSLSEEVAKAVAAILDSRPATKVDSSDRLEALVESQAKVGASNVALVEGQGSLASALSRLQVDITTRFDKSHRQLEEQFAEQAKVSGDVAELESQLAKARNENGKARSEKAALLDRLEADRTRHAAEIQALQAAKQSRDDLSKESDIEKALLQQTVERLQEELKASNSKANSLDALLLSARDQEDARHATELQHIAALSENQVKTRLLEGEATASRRQIESLSEEKDRLRSELSELREAHERLSTERRGMDLTLRDSIEKAAAAQGEIGSLEKRVASQDEKISNLQRLNSSKQQALATVNQRATELEKRSTELEAARADLAEIALISSELQDRLVASESAGDQLREETQVYRERFSSIEQDLVTMREAVGRELQDSSDRFIALKEEHAQLLRQKSDLARDLEDARARQQSTDYPPPSSHPIPRPQTAQPTLSQHYAAPPSTYSPRSQSPLPAPQSRHASSPAGIVYAQRTGFSQGTVHDPSPSPSRLGKTIERGADGWWGA